MTFNDINFSNKKVLMRVDFNVPLNDNFEVTDATRIEKAIPTIQKILRDGGSVILMSHLGRPKVGPEEKYSLKHIVPTLSKLLGVDVKFANDCIGEEAKKISSSLKGGEVLLLENLRFYKHETAGDTSFAEKLADLGDFYINEAFGTAHRAHASTAIIAQFFSGNKCFGYLMENEIESLEKVLNSNEKPVTAIVGGAKVSSKIDVLSNLITKVDHILIGGGMAYTFAKALGGNVGISLVENDKLDEAREIMKKAKESGVSIHLPSDSVNADAFSNEATTAHSSIDAIQDNMMGLDIGEQTIKAYHEVIVNSKVILWNGPMGVFEMSNFEKGTKEVANAVVEATKNGAFTLIGGGDSVAAINKYDLASEVSYVSTGGGAMLEYIEGKKLPGIVAIQKPEGLIFQ